MKAIYKFEIPKLEETVIVEVYSDGMFSQYQDSVRCLRKMTELGKLVIDSRESVFCQIAEALPEIGVCDKNIQWREIAPSLGILRIFQYVDNYLKYLEE